MRVCHVPFIRKTCCEAFCNLLIAVFVLVVFLQFFHRAPQKFLAKLRRIRLLIWQKWLLFYETKMVIFPQFEAKEATKDGNKYKFHEPTVK